MTNATQGGAAVMATGDEVARLVDRIREAASRRTSLRIVGAGRWLDAGRLVRAEQTLDVGSAAGIVEYVPGDLTLTARAGTTLAALERATAEHGQWLTLDPFGDERGTLGATIATGSYGPLATAFGTPRDIVLGVEFVTGTGAVVRAGGRVVKNVAGFDLARLVIGSWGSLGVITEITVRLRAKPEIDETLALVVGDGVERVAAITTALRALPFTPYAAELVNPALAERLGLEPRPLVLVRLGGSAAAVGSQRSALAEIGDARAITGPLWPNLRAIEPRGSATIRFSRLPSRFSSTWHDAVRLVEPFPGSFVHGSVLRGVVRCIVPDVSTARDGGRGHALVGVEDRLARALTAPFDGTRIFERVPAAIWRAFAPSAVADRLSQGVKAAYDPHCILNPGILGDCLAR